jgi:multiple sugar transport system permease protein
MLSRLTLGRRDRLGHTLFVVPAYLYILLFFGYPLAKNIWMSFVDFRTATFVTGEAPWVGWQNYREVLDLSVLPTAAVNTLLITAVTVVAQLVIGLALATFFTRSFPGSRLLASVIPLPWLLPLVTTAAIWQWLLRDDGPLVRLFGASGSPLADTSLALVALIGINIWLGVPFYVIILTAALQNVPVDQLEAAELDGAGPWRRFVHVTIPSIRPQLAVSTTLTVIYTLKILELPLILTGGGPANSTQTLGTVAYNLSFEKFEFGQGAAVGNLLMLVTLVFALFYVVQATRGEHR